MKIASSLLLLAALVVGCEKSSPDTANPDDATKTETPSDAPTDAPADAPTDAEAPADPAAPAEGDAAAAPEG